MFYYIILLYITVASRYKAPITAAFIICSLTILPSLYSTQVFAASPYDSGYDHGCDDAGISDPSERYINQDEKGPAYHTSEFMDGYYAGVEACSASSDDNEDEGRSNEPRETGKGLKLIVGSNFDPANIPSNYDGLYFSINGREEDAHMDIRDAIYPDEGGIDAYVERAFEFAENSVEIGEPVEV